MKILSFILISLFFLVNCSSTELDEPLPEDPVIELPTPLEVGNSLSISRITGEKMDYYKSVGIKHVEAGGMNQFFDTNRALTKTGAEITSLFTQAKKAADDAGINIWSVHMAFGEEMDLSLIRESSRQRVVEAHKELLEYLSILDPEVILFHPSYYLDPPNQRDMRKSQLIKSVKELDQAVRDIGAVLVIENMLGPELMAGDRERPLMRTVEESVELFNRLPATIKLAVDMNHIEQPERLVRALGNRLKTVHIADGTGRAENHWFPCSGEGKNDWTEILSALDEVDYAGPFLFECAYPDEKDLVECYQTLYDQFVQEKYKQ
jgi:sugar phosphate isomerase/epimerase